MTRRILLVEFYGIGGTGDYAGCLAEALAAAGDEVVVVTSTAFEPISTAGGFRIERVFDYAPEHSKLSKGVQLAAGLGRAHRIIRELEPDVVHVQGTVIPALESIMYGRKRSSAMICTVHDVASHEWRPWLGSFRRFYSRFDHLVCHSHSSLRDLQVAGVRTPATVIPHGRYTPLAIPAVDREVARQMLGIAASARVVLMFGYLRRYKGLEVLLDAIRIANAKDNELVLIVAGRPLYDVNRVVERARNDGLPVVWDLEYVPRGRLGLYFGATDVVALPYVRTSDSGAVELAAAYGKPVVVSALGGLCEAFRRYRFGAVVPVGAPEPLAQTLMLKYKTPSHWEVSNTWKVVAEETRLLYGRVLKGHDRLSAWRAK